MVEAREVEEGAVAVIVASMSEGVSSDGGGDSGRRSGRRGGVNGGDDGRGGGSGDGCRSDGDSSCAESMAGGARGKGAEEESSVRSFGPRIGQPMPFFGLLTGKPVSEGADAWTPPPHEFDAQEVVVFPGQAGAEQSGPVSKPSRKQAAKRADMGVLRQVLAASYESWNREQQDPNAPKACQIILWLFDVMSFTMATALGDSWAPIGYISLFASGMLTAAYIVASSYDDGLGMLTICPYPLFCCSYSTKEKTRLGAIVSLAAICTLWAAAGFYALRHKSEAAAVLKTATLGALVGARVLVFVIGALNTMRMRRFLNNASEKLYGRTITDIRDRNALVASLGKRGERTIKRALQVEYRTTVPHDVFLGLESMWLLTKMLLETAYLWFLMQAVLGLTRGNLHVGVAVYSFLDVALSFKDYMGSIATSYDENKWRGLMYVLGVTTALCLVVPDVVKMVLSEDVEVRDSIRSLILWTCSYAFRVHTVHRKRHFYQGVLCRD